MLISKPVADGIRHGTVTQAFRRWDLPRVKVGGTQLTSAGVVGFGAVTRVRDPSRLTERDARTAGLSNLAALQKQLAPSVRRPSARGGRGGRGGEHVYRIRLRWVGEDPRIALRETPPGAAELTDIADRLARLDSGAQGAWTRQTLEWVRDHPRVVSKELAALRQVDLLPMKSDIRKLKALGLTISHDVGYELSPRGHAFLDSLLKRNPAH